MVDGTRFREWVQERVITAGLVEVYKPYGVPSTAIVEMYKRVTGEKVGHGGTLDPLAEGALKLGIGKGTKLLTQQLASEKRYRTTMLFGAQTFSGDLELPLEIPERKEELDGEKINEILEELGKGYIQELPLLSAAKHRGKSSYELVRAGKEVEKRTSETRLIEWTVFENKQIIQSELIALLKETGNRLRESFAQFVAIGEQIGYFSSKHKFLLEKWEKSFEASISSASNAVVPDFMVLDLEVFVPKGTYVRSLVAEIASRFSTVGVLLRLERVSDR